MSYARKMILKPHLEPKYHLLYNRNEDIGLNLFGDDVAKRIKEINETHKLQGYMCRKPAGSKNYCAPGQEEVFAGDNHIPTTIKGLTDQTSTEGATEMQRSGWLYSTPKEILRKITSTEFPD